MNFRLSTGPQLQILALRLEHPYTGDMSEQNAPEDDVKRKFREALEKKNAQHRTGESHTDSRGAVTEAHGQAGHKREFRRKSG